MKKTLIFTLAIVLAAGCTKEKSAGDTASAFKLFLSTVDTKTTNDGLSTKWVNGDQLMVYHAVAGTTDYVKDGSGNTAGKFTITDADKGEATPTTAPTLSEGSYDWYVFYRFNRNNTVTKSQAQIISQAPGASSVQEGNSSMAHLAGTMFPLCGIARNVKSTDNPTVHMKNVVSVVEFKIKSGFESMQVKKIEMSVPENIVGSFFIDYSQDTPVLTPNGTSVDNQAVLDINNGENILSGENATFYLCIAPFTLKSGETMVITVTVSDGVNEGSQSFNYLAPEDIDFKSGKIRPLEFTINSIS